MSARHEYQKHLTHELRELMEALSRGFSNYDLEALCRHFTLPAVFVRDDETTVAMTDRELEKLLFGQMARNRKAGVVRVEFSALDEISAGSQLCLIRFEILRFLKDDKPIDPIVRNMVARMEDNQMKINGIIGNPISPPLNGQ